MTRSVFDEATVAARPDAAGLRALADRRPGFAVIAAPRRYGAMIGADIGRLHRGERDTLHHYLCGAARFIIIDDRKALQVCRRYGIPHVNALLCPKLLHFGGFMPEGHRVDACMDRLAGLGRYSAPVIQWARSCRRTDLAFFIGGRGQ